jgi:hypothetical protein
MLRLRAFSTKQKLLYVEDMPVRLLHNIEAKKKIGFFMIPYMPIWRKFVP